MLEMNKVMLIGNLTRDPEMSYLANGTALTKMGLAVSRSFKNAAGEFQDEVAFVDLTAWAQRAEFAGKFFKKGTRVYVEGRLNFQTWEAPDGTKRSKLDVTVDNIDFVLTKAQQEAQGSGGGGAPQQAPPQAAPAAQTAPPAAPAPGAPPPADNTADDLPY